MPRKKQPTTTTAQAPDDAANAASSATATAELPPEAPAVQPAAPPAPLAPRAMTTTALPQNSSPAAENGGTSEGRTWAVPYQQIFASQEKGFEMGENRRFKQRVFLFKDKPEEHIRAALKEHGFVYRPAERAWTIEASPANRVLSEHLAKVFSGQSQGMSR